jgi:hypothetical protein
MAKAGNKASPSLLIALPIWADNGMNPAKYMVVINTCGPQPGRNPIRTDINGVKTAHPSKINFRSIAKK